MEPIRIAMVAGEASGDLLGSRLIDALARRYPGAQFFGIGGPKMIAAGLDSWFEQEKLAVRGLVEVVRHLRELLGIRRALVRGIKAARPHLFIGIDAPDFNLGLERKLKRAGITTAHLVSPTVWAWRRGRINTVRKAVSHMLVIFPFEEEIYRQAGIPVTFVGHPLADEIPAEIDRDAIREQLRVPLAAKVITLLPGSRQNELEQMAEPFIATAKLIAQRLPEVQFLVPFVTRETRDQFNEALYRADATGLPMRMLFGHAQEAIAACDVALATSGTVTLEAALLRCPMVIAYRVAPLSYAIARRMIRIDHIGLPNILCGEWVVPELVQDDMTPENLAQALLNLLHDERAKHAVSDRFAAIHALMQRNAAESAADALAPLIGAAARQAA